MNKIFFSILELANMTDSVVVGDPDYLISNIADLESAEVGDASFFSNPRYEQVMKKSKAGVIIIKNQSDVIPGKNFLINADPSKAFQKILEAFYPATHKLTSFIGIHPSAIIHESATIGENVVIGPKAVIDGNAKIGDNTFIGAGSYIGHGTTIGDNCLIHANVTIRELCKIGNNVILHPGVVIGSCGFGLITDSEGKHQKLLQVGSVTIDDDVEIGSNSTVDRSRFKSTYIGRGTKIDNLVQIGHGVKIGSNCIIVAQSGIAGSSTLADNVVLGGQVGISGHVNICKNVAISAKSGVSKDINESGNYRGVPAIPIEEFNKNAVYLRRIEKLVNRVHQLEVQVNELSQKESCRKSISSLHISRGR
mgnify:CR=1 FL=1